MFCEGYCIHISFLLEAVRFFWFIFVTVDIGEFSRAAKFLEVYSLSAFCANVILGPAHLLVPLREMVFASEVLIDLLLLLLAKCSLLSSDIMLPDMEFWCN